MRFPRLALGAVALLTLSSSFTGRNGYALAEEAPPADTVDISDIQVSSALPEDAETYEFEAEVHRMLDIVVNSLYQNKDVFLRELISNASDALDKIRFLAISKPELMAGKPELEVKIEYDAEKKTLTVRDSGIGMTHDDLVKNLGTVARSGTTKFMEAMAEGSADIGMIGKFGVGFYSTFLVADRVTVASKHPSSDTQYLWESLNGESSFKIAEDPRGDTLGRGTEITLHLKEDCEEYADASTIERLATHYSEFVTHPIQLRTTTTEKVEIYEEDEGDDEDEFSEKSDDELDVAEDEEDKPPKEPKFEEITTHSWKEMNPEPALWTRDKDGISDEEHQAFYHVLSKQEQSNATSWIHFNAEGNINFKSLLYLPSELPQEMATGQLPTSNKGGLKLYVRKVLISDEFDLLPNWLMMIKGVVDSDDLPLNVNRETLQESKIIKVIYKKMVRKVIEMIRKFSEEEAPAKEVELDEEGNIVEEEEAEHPYTAWYKKFHTMLKVGAIEDESNRAKLMKLLRFQTSKTKEGEMISLKEYVENMKEWQKDIFFISGMSRQEVENSQFLEKFAEKDVEVVFCTDPIDEYLVQNVRDFDGKKFSAITKDGIKFGDEDEDLEKRRDKAYSAKYKPLTKWLKSLYGNGIMRVAISKRLGSAPAIVSTGEWGHTANMARIMQAQAFGAQNDMMGGAMKILEINPRHPFIVKLLEGAPPLDEDEAADFKPDAATVDAAWMIHDMALLNGGFDISDPKAYSVRMTRVLKSSLNVDSLSLEDEIDPPVEEDEPPEIDMDGNQGINLQDLDDFNMDDLDDF
mmetsp:Transcript_3662/g.4836  ORF Transcript_3662/g.4836 Transcript_3662/m.4836 type:complete len:805 (+) Transcript_3662:108-2522(+)